jgi:MFS family permease
MPTDPPRPTLRGNLRAMPAPVWILAGGSFLNRFGSFVFPFLLLYVRHLGYSPSQAGLALSAYGLGALAAAGLGGWMADRLGRRASIVLSMVASAAAMLALSQVRSLAAIVPLTFAAGCAAESYRPASSALLADVVAPARRVTAFAVYRLAVNAGFSVGPVVGGLLAERSFGFLFLGDAATSLLYAIVAWRFLPEGRRPERRGEPSGAFRVARRDRPFLLVCAATFLTASVYSQAFSTLALRIRGLGLPPIAYGALISINGGLIVLTELPLTSFTMRRPVRPVLAIGYVLTALGFSATGLATAFPALVATVFVWTVGEIVESPVAAAFVAGLAPAHLRGRYQGIWTSMFALAFIVGPAAGAALFEASQPVLWIACAILPVVSGSLVLSIDRDRAEATRGALEEGGDARAAPAAGFPDPPGSALDPGEGDPLDERPLGQEEQEDDGQHEEQ